MKPKTVSYDESGYYKWQNKNGFLMTTLQDFKSRPAHMDQLHIDIWHRGQNILCDNGTYSYATDLGDTLSKTASHNVIKVGNIEQMDKRGAFFVYNWTKKVKASFDNRKFNGKFVSNNGYTHERTIEKNNEAFIVREDVETENSKFTVIFNTPCDVEKVENGIKLFVGNLLIAKIVINGRIEIKNRYRSKYYLQKEKISQIEVEFDIINGRGTAMYEIELY